MGALFRGATRAGRTGKSPIQTYLLTLTTWDRMPRLGHSLDGKTVRESALGRAIKRQLDALVKEEEDIDSVNSVVMPNHVHLLVTIKEGRPLLEEPEMPDFAPFCKRIKKRAEEEYHYYTLGDKHGLWDAGFFVEPILSESERDAALRMIRQNPEQWASDEFYGE